MSNLVVNAAWQRAHAAIDVSVYHQDGRVCDN
jgi:hypothetical protein